MAVKWESKRTIISNQCLLVAKMEMIFWQVSFKLSLIWDSQTTHYMAHTLVRLRSRTLPYLSASLCQALVLGSPVEIVVENYISGSSSGHSDKSDLLLRQVFLQVPLLCQLSPTEKCSIPVSCKRLNWFQIMSVKPVLSCDIFLSSISLPKAIYHWLFQLS